MLHPSVVSSCCHGNGLQSDASRGANWYLLGAPPTSLVQNFVLNLQNHILIWKISIKF